MPSVGLLRQKLDSYGQEVVIIQEAEVNAVTVSRDNTECMKLLQSPVKACRSQSPNLSSHGSSNSLSCSAPQVAACDMNYNSNPNLSQGHPIDELTAEPVDTTGRSPGRLLPESNHSSSDFGPFVSGFTDEFRQRSSSFNTGMLRGATRPTSHGEHTDDHIRRFSEVHCSPSKSAENVTIGHPHNVGHLRHSHTVPEIPPHALSNDSGYHTPPNRTQGHTSPPWPPNRPMQWPTHVESRVSSAQAYFPTCPSRAGSRSSAPLPLSQGLTIETSGHYQPEPNTPQIVVGQPIYPQSMQPMYNPSFQRNSHDAYSSLQSQGSTPRTPEEGICGYQRERKNRLVNAFQSEEGELARLKLEEEQLREIIQSQLKDNNDIDSTEQLVQNMTIKNQKLTSEIRALQRACSNIPRILTTAPRPDIITQQPSTQAIVCTASTGLSPRTYEQVPSPSPPPLYTMPNTMINNVPAILPPTPGRTAPPVPPRPSQAAEAEQWECSQCTFKNHYLISSCEMCDAARPRPGNSTPSATGLVKTSACQHQSACFCHAHLG